MLKQNKKKVVLIGYKSFIQSNLYNHLSKKFFVKKLRFEKISENKLKQYDYVINCSNSKNFFEKKYSKSNDRNLIIANIIKSSYTKFILLSTRQVYYPKLNITEKSKLRPINHYARNCLKSEKFCMKGIGNKLLILRLSNVIGFENSKKKKASLMSTVIQGLKKKKIYFDNNYYLKKDFLPIEILCIYIEKLIYKNFYGILNVGSGKAILVKNLINKTIDIKKIQITVKLKKNFKDKDFCFKITKLQRLIGVKTNMSKGLNKCFSQIKKKLKQFK